MEIHFFFCNEKYTRSEREKEILLLMCKREKKFLDAMTSDKKFNYMKVF